MPDLSNPSPRGMELYTTLNNLFHIYIADDETEARMGFSREEHLRRHTVFYVAFMSGMEYLAEYPERGAKLLGEFRRLLTNGTTREDCDLAAEAIRRALYPESSAVNQDKVFEMAKVYKPETSSERVRPVLDGDGVKWENVEPDKLPFPTFEEDFQQWQ